MANQKHIEELLSQSKELGCRLEDVQAELLIRHLELVLEKNNVLNLTSVRTIEEGVKIHIIDSLSILEFVNDAPAGEFCDLGSGAGYPGIPISIVTGRKGVLVDSSKKKMNAVDEFIEALGLRKYLVTYNDRIETLTVNKSRKYPLVVARALTSLPSLLELASPLLEEGGLLIAMKGQPEDDEIERGMQVAVQVGMKSAGIYKRNIDPQIERKILLYRKEGKSRVRLPRRIGLAQNKPLA